MSLKLTGVQIPFQAGEEFDAFKGALYTTGIDKDNKIALVQQTAYALDYIILMGKSETPDDKEELLGGILAAQRRILDVSSLDLVLYQCGANFSKGGQRSI